MGCNRLRALRRLIALVLLTGACATAYRDETTAVTATDKAGRSAEAEQGGGLLEAVPDSLGGAIAVDGDPVPADLAPAPAPAGAATAPAAGPPTGAEPAPIGAGAAPTPAAPAAPAPPPSASTAAGPFTLSHNPDGSVARWDPCRPITWKANLTLAPPGALDDLLEAFDELAEATGMSFRYGGITTAIPTGDWLTGSRDDGVIIVAWVPTAVSDLWTEVADGRGGWYAKGSSPDGATWTWRVVRGFVLIEPTATKDYAAGFGAGLTRGALLLHELAHAVGLSHVEDRSQLMFPTLGRETAARYATGDLAGLAMVGRNAGCIS